MSIKLRFPSWLEATRRDDRYAVLRKMSDKSLGELQSYLLRAVEETAIEQERRRAGLKSIPKHLGAKVIVKLVDARLWWGR